MDLRLKTTQSGKSYDCREGIDRFRKAPFWKCVTSTRKQNVGVFKLLHFEERFFKKLRFYEGLAWTVHLTVDFPGTMWTLPQRREFDVTCQIYQVGWFNYVNDFIFRNTSCFINAQFSTEIHKFMWSILSRVWLPTEMDHMKYFYQLFYGRLNCSSSL